jgi:hypothetical protein
MVKLIQMRAPDNRGKKWEHSDAHVVKVYEMYLSGRMSAQLLRRR